MSSSAVKRDTTHLVFTLYFIVLGAIPLLILKHSVQQGWHKIFSGQISLSGIVIDTATAVLSLLIICVCAYWATKTFKAFLQEK